MTLKIQPFCQSQSKVTVVSGNIDQSKPDVHFNSHIDPYISWTLIGCVQMHKCMAPAQNRLSCALVEEVEGGLNDIRAGKTN